MTLKRRLLRVSSVIGLVLGIFVFTLAMLDLVQAKQTAADITIVKSPDTQTVVTNGTANFTIAVTNTGTVSLTNVAISDALVPDCDNVLGTLEVDEHQSYSCALNNVADGMVNSVTVTGTPSAGGVVTGSAAAKVRLDETASCPTSMVAYWKLDEPSTGSYDDYYYGYDGECTDPSCPNPVAGVYIGGQEFDGSTTGITVTAVPGDSTFDWGPADSFSIELWLETDSASTCLDNQVAIGRRDPSGKPSWWVGCWDGGQAAFYLEDSFGGADKTELVGTTDVADGDPHHIVAVRDGGAGVTRLYVDGSEEHSKSGAYDNGFGSATAALNLGWLDVSGGYHLDGVVDEVAIYDAVLSPAEIKQHHNEGLAGRWYCQSGNYAPQIVSTEVTDAAYGLRYTYDVEAAGSPDPTYTLLALPSGMTIVTSTGLISWAPTIAQLGTHAVEVEARNSEGEDTQGFAITVTQGTVCPQDMISYWKLDETSGAAPYYDFYDGHDSQCSDINSCPSPGSGRVGGGQVFSSTTAVAVPSNAAFDWSPSSSFSIEFWMQTDSSNTCAANQVVVGRSDPSETPAWWVGCADGGGASFFLRDSLGTTGEVEHTVDVTDGAWHHVVASRDASAGTINIYVDGDAGISESVVYTASFGTSASVNLGWLNVGSEFHFAGTVDEVALYDRALPAGEIQEHYWRGTAGQGYCVNPFIEIAKTPDDQRVSSGSSVTFTIAVTNTGDATLTNVTIQDASTPVCAFSATTLTLAADAVYRYTCTATNVISDFINSAAVTGTLPYGPNVSDSDTASVIVTDVDQELYIYLPLVLKS